jgi:integrase
MAKNSGGGDGLKKLGPGKWLARITARDKDTGKKSLDTTRVILADTKLEALNKRKALASDLLGTGAEWTVAEAIEAWLPTQPPGSLSVRKTHSDRFRAKFGSRKLSLVTTPEFQRWLAELTCSDDTANGHRASIMALYKFARGQGRLVGHDTAAASVKRVTAKTASERLAELEQGQLPSALFGDELGEFFATLEAHSPDVAPLMRTQYLLGCRIGEVIALQVDAVNWDTGAVTIVRNCAKDGTIVVPKNKKRRPSAVGPDGLAFLRGHRAAMERAKWPGYEKWLFPRPPFTGRRTRDTWVYETVRQRVKAALEAAGFELSATTHAMRYTHVTRARALQTDAMMREAVGHADARQSRHYTDLSAHEAAAVGYARDFEAQVAGGVASGVTDLSTRRAK